MKKQHPDVSDLVANHRSKTQSVEFRIQRRIEVLREWLMEGIPVGKAVPKSLNEARIWDDADLGILPIGSPNEFTTTHHLNGNLVSEIASLLTKLKKRFGKPQRQSNSMLTSKAAKFDRNAFDRQLKAAISQWHSERDMRLQEKKRADAAEMRSVMLLEENRQKDELIADLRRQLARQKGLKVVK